MSVISAGVVLLAMLFAVQFALAYYARQVLAGAAQDGAAAGARRDGSSAEAEAVTSGLIEQAGSTLVGPVEIEVGVEGDRLVVTVTGTALTLIPLGRDVAVSARGAAPLEEFRAQEVGS